MSAKVAFRQLDAERLIAAVQAKGLPIAEVIVTDGQIRILTQPGAKPEARSSLERWREKRGHSAA